VQRRQSVHRGRVLACAEKLSSMAYKVLHDQATERPFTSPLLKVCARAPWCGFPRLAYLIVSLPRVPTRTHTGETAGHIRLRGLQNRLVCHKHKV